jgi:quinol monooxygenase YgiN
MSETMQHWHVTIIPKADKIAEVRELLIETEKQISLKKAENGPVSWCVSSDETENKFFIEALFPNQEAVTFHTNNVDAISNQIFPLIAAPPEAIIRSVFLSVH